MSTEKRKIHTPFYLLQVTLKNQFCLMTSSVVHHMIEEVIKQNQFCKIAKTKINSLLKVNLHQTFLFSVDIKLSNTFLPSMNKILQKKAIIFFKFPFGWCFMKSQLLKYMCLLFCAQFAHAMHKLLMNLHPLHVQFMQQTKHNAKSV